MAESKLALTNMRAATEHAEQEIALVGDLYRLASLDDSDKAREQARDSMRRIRASVDTFFASVCRIEFAQRKQSSQSESQ